MKRFSGEYFHSLRFQLLVTVMLAWLIPTAVFSQFLFAVLPDYRRMTENSLTTGAEYAWSQMTENLEHLITLSRDSTYDEELLDAWEKHRQGTIGDAEFVRQSRNYLERKYGREAGCLCAVFLPENVGGMLLSPRSDAERMNLFRDQSMGEVCEVLSETDTRTAFLNSAGRVYLVRNLLDDQMRRFGSLVLEVDREALTAPLETVRAQWNAESWIGLDRIQSENAPWEGIEPGLSLDGEENVRYLKLSDSRDWKLRWLLYVPGETVFGQIRVFRRVLIGLYLLLIPVLWILSMVIYRRFSRPVSLLVGASRKIEAGEFGAAVPMHGRDELGTLGRAFSAMSARLKELIDRTYKEEIALRDARIQALQSRINPHFINNALEDINWQARMDGSENVSRMVNALSILLNATMANKDRRVVSLREELSVADAYLFFVQERFGEDLTWDRQIDDSLLDCSLPLLTLQPVLENAVEHGIAPAGGGAISIRIGREGNRMRVDIENTGRMISPEDQARIQQALAGEQPGNHIGLSNIASRLRLIYRGEASITVERVEDRTRVRMEIPFGEKEESRG